MTVFEGIRLGIQFVCLDIWLIWLIFIIADMIISHKWFKKQDKDLEEAMHLLENFNMYQKTTEDLYKDILKKLEEKEI